MHVPDGNLPRYRALRTLMRAYESLGTYHSGIGEYAEANEAWAKAGAYRKRMAELRFGAKSDDD